MASHPDLVLALQIGAWCNNARLLPSAEGGESWSVLGDPTEGALGVAALKAGIELKSSGAGVVFELPFESDRRTMSVVIRDPAVTAGGVETATMYTKGAVEAVLPRCLAERRDGEMVPLSDLRRAEILEWNTSAGGQGLPGAGPGLSAWLDSGGGAACIGRRSAVSPPGRSPAAGRGIGPHFRGASGDDRPTA